MPLFDRALSMSVMDLERDRPKMPENSTVCIVDDDRAVLSALTSLLTAEGYAVRAHESAGTFLDMIERDDCGCLVTDVRMPGMSGLDLLAKLKERRVSMPVIVITAHGDVPLAIAAMKEGAIHFFEKPFDGDALLDSVRGALEREESEPAPDAETQMIKDRFATLTKREKEVLAGLLNGQPNKTIAYELGISARTIEVHRANMMKKTQATSLAELVRMALIAMK
jgi:two-component system, LuxR family, response regulator FixJ